MTEIEPLSTGAATTTPVPTKSVPESSAAPEGRQITSVQPHPTPMVAAQPEAEAHPGELARMQHVAQAKADITGTGRLIDITV